MAKRLVAFFKLSRFKFLAGGLIAGGLGTAIAGYERGSIDLRTYVLAQLTLTVTHQMTHYANEYFDRETDARTTRTAFSGGSGVLVDGSLAPVVAIVAALVCLLLGVAGTIALFATGHRLAAELAAAIVILAWTYSAPPVRLLARGLGEFDTALVIGLLAPACAYAAQTGAVDARLVTSVLPLGCAMFAMMMSVEWPDVDADGATGKRNLVVRYGARGAAGLGLTALLAAGVGAGVAMIVGAPHAYGIAALVALVPALVLAAAFITLGKRGAFEPAALARRGVTAFVTTGLCLVAGYLVPR